jgi:RNA polymerase sigma-70 factor (ECF subfamily)
LINTLIIQGCKANDSRCQRLLFDECFNVLMKVGKRYTTNDDEASDIVNRSFLKILQNLDTIKDENTFFGWIKQIAVHTAIDAVRSKKKYIEKNKFVIDDDERRAPNSIGVEANAEESFNANDIFKVMYALPNVTREVVNMIIVDGYNHKEVAEALNITEENSRRHLNKGRNILKEKLAHLRNYYSSDKQAAQ